MTIPNSVPPTPPTEPTADAIDQAADVLKRFAAGHRLTQTGDIQASAAFLLASVGIAIGEQLRRIADVMEANHD